MPFENLPDFLTRLQDEGGLVRITSEVDPHGEITEIHRRLASRPGVAPALFFERVQGSPLPLVVNLFGSVRRICRALDAESFDDLRERLAQTTTADSPENWFQKLKKLGNTSPNNPWKPQVVKTGLCQQVVRVGRDIDLRELPAVQAWPDEAGRFFHRALALFRHPDDGQVRLESFPVQVLDRHSLGLYWQPHQAIQHVWKHHVRHTSRMPVAIVLGGDPAWQLLSAIPAPPQADVMVWGGCLRGKPLDIVRGRVVDFEVPASAEIVIEGYLEGGESLTRGGCLALDTGWYAPARDIPNMHVTTVTHRGNPVPVTMLPLPAPSEQSVLDQLYISMCLPLLQAWIPELTDLHIPQGATRDQWVFAGLRKSHPQHARQVLQALWGSPWLRTTKGIVVVDEDVPLRHQQQVWTAIAQHVRPDRDQLTPLGMASQGEVGGQQVGTSQKLGFDATRKWAEEGQPEPLPEPLQPWSGLQQRIQSRWPEFQLGPFPG